MVIANKMEDAKSSIAVHDLPCGYIDSDGELHTEVELTEITGHEEDMLASNSTPDYKKMTVLIGRCIKRIGSITDRGQIAAIASELSIGDRTYLIFAIRRVTLGDDYPFKVKCPSCEEEGLYNIDLSELEIQEMADPKTRVFDVDLPSGKSCRFRIMTGKDEERLGKIKRLDDKLSMSMAVRMESLQGTPPTLKDVKGLGLRDRDFLRTKFDEVDGGVDTTIEIACSACGHEFEDELNPGQSGFFFPSATRKNSKRKSSTW
jgi:hypothetical protein